MHSRGVDVMEPRQARSESVGDVQVFDGVSSIRCGDMLLLLWQTPARRERILRAAAWMDEALAVNAPGTIVVCQFLLKSASPPDREGRAYGKREALRLAPSVRRAVMVPLGDSIWQNVVRGILRAAVLIAGHEEKLKIAGTESQAIDYVAESRTERSVERGVLVVGVERLYEALGIARGKR